MDSTRPEESGSAVLCSQCGGKNEVPTGQRFVTCVFCDSTLFVDRAQVVFHYRLPPLLAAEEATAALRRWMAGNDTVKDLDRKAKIEDHMVHDGLWDIVNDFHMGISNELCSERYNITREDQDQYAAESYRRVLEAISAGRFKDEIVPVEIPQRKGDPVIFDQDECPQETSFDSLCSFVRLH